MNEAQKSARESLALGYAIRAREDPNSPDISPTGFSLFYRECPERVSLKEAWERITRSPTEKRSVNNWHAGDPDPTA